MSSSVCMVTSIPRVPRTGLHSPHFPALHRHPCMPLPSRTGPIQYHFMIQVYVRVTLVALEAAAVPCAMICGQTAAQCLPSYRFQMLLTMCSLRRMEALKCVNYTGAASLLWGRQCGIVFKSITKGKLYCCNQVSGQERGFCDRNSMIQTCARRLLQLKAENLIDSNYN